jgi:hypothetical protein
LQDYRATSSKAEVEEQKGLDDPKLTEQEAADKIRVLRFETRSRFSGPEFK